MENLLSPIVLFTYNRPRHTLSTLQALSKNELASKSTLYIYCDGPKPCAPETTLDAIREVRKIVREKHWCREVYITEYDTNKGLANSIKEGIDNVFRKSERIIVMEDDLITSPSFLNYMNEALNYYQNRKTVFSISGYNLPPGKLKIPEDYPYDVYVSLRNSSWGWATWKDRWEQVDWKLTVFDEISSNKNIIEAFNRGGEDVYPMLMAQKSGALDIWSIQFTLAHFVNHAVSISPVVSYVDNIGLDASGEHCKPDTSLKNPMLNENKHPEFLDVLYEDKRIINAYCSAFYPYKRPVWQKMVNRISRILGGKNVYTLKKKVYC
jgi:hypothetical protein